MHKKIIKQKNVSSFSLSEQHAMIQAYLSTGCSKQYIWQKYTGKDDHGRFLQWMRKLGYVSMEGTDFQQLSKPTQTYRLMKQNKQEKNTISYNAEIEHLSLKKRIAELEQPLSKSELRSIAYMTMIEIAEKEFNISIKKKYNTKP